MTELPEQMGGLSSEEAAKRLAGDGPNELPAEKKRTFWRIALEVVKEPMFLMLLGGGGIYLLLGDVEEAALLLLFVFLVMGITLHQERKTERALERLRDLSSPRAAVVRDGRVMRIAGRDVVRGDLVILSEGDRIPADGYLFSATNLMVDESLLTGESAPVRKQEATGEKTATPSPGGDDLPFVYSGTLVVQGRGFAEIIDTGAQTAIGQIGQALQGLQLENTLLQKEIKRLVLQLSMVGLTLCALVVLFFCVQRGSLLQGVLAGITLAMAILPEEFPVVLTVFMALGAWRLSQNQVLTRRMAVIETLGAATVLCVDKTGTLTQNQMAVKAFFTDGRYYELQDEAGQQLPEELHELVEFSILASQRDPLDPMEKAFKQLGDDYLQQTEHLHADWEMVREYPLLPGLLALSHIWRSPQGSCYIVAAKGAPEAVLDLCHLDEEARQALMRQVERMALDGMRVLGVAKAEYSGTVLPDGQHDFAFQFVGLTGLADPLRPNAHQAIEACHEAGMRVVMITGDYAGTAACIAAEAGLDGEKALLTGPELRAMRDDELQQRIGDVSIIARAVPEDKLRIVNALKANGEVVAMTGDGVNDAPALKAAHIGIAMGGRGTDVAREAAGLVLLDDDFSSIVRAVAMGRRIYDNLKKATAYIVAIHIPIIGMSVLPLAAGWPLVLYPAHVVLLEMLIDPACAVVFEAERMEAGAMRRPPRHENEALLSRDILFFSLAQGISAFVITALMFWMALILERGADEARAFAFVTLIMGNVAMILTNRSWSDSFFGAFRSHNRALGWVTGGAVLFVGLILYFPFLRDIFRFAELHLEDVAICLAVWGGSLLWFEVLKKLRRRFCS